jgi:hypothetical protein
MTIKRIISHSIKAFSIIAGIFIIALSFLLGGVTLGESYNFINPYADTEFAKDYSPEKFKNIRPGMHLQEVISITGEPLSSDFDTTRGLLYHSYTRDGYLLRKNSFSLCKDLAWYGSSVEYNKDSIAVIVYSGWYYD